MALGDANNGGTYSPTITVEDGTDTVSEVLFWTVNSAIRLTPTVDQSNTEGDSVGLQIHASDATGGVTLTYSASGLPQGLSINSGTGLISGTIALGDGNNGGSYAPVITVGDGTSSVRENINWAVSSAITVTPLADQTSPKRHRRLQVQASDATSGATLTYGASNLPIGLSINPSTGLISGTIVTGAATPAPTRWPCPSATAPTMPPPSSTGWSTRPFPSPRTGARATARGTPSASRSTPPTAPAAPP